MLEAKFSNGALHSYGKLIHHFYTSMFPYPALINKKGILQRAKKAYIGREGEEFDQTYDKLALFIVNK